MEIIYLAPIIGLIVGYNIGKYYDRIAWGNLIHKGKLPKPKR